MDDGFQNFQLAKDLSFVVVDSETGFGNGRLIPAGPLREPVDQGLARADAVVLLGEGALPLPSFGGPVIRAALHPTAPDRFAGRSVFAMAGIGRPEKFFHTLQAMGAHVVGTRAFPDHHRYTLLEIEARQADRRKRGSAAGDDGEGLRPHRRESPGWHPLRAGSRGLRGRPESGRPA